MSSEPVPSGPIPDPELAGALLLIMAQHSGRAFVLGFHPARGGAVGYWYVSLDGANPIRARTARDLAERIRERLGSADSPV